MKSGGGETCFMFGCSVTMAYDVIFRRNDVLKQQVTYHVDQT